MEESLYISQVFDMSCKTATEGWEAAAWASEKNQKFLFQWALSLIGELNGDSILDVGCGQADFFGYLNYENYKGIDISSEMIKAAKKKFPEADVEVCDIDEYQTMHDWVVAIGPFNLDIHFTPNGPIDEMNDAFNKSRQMQYLKTALENMYRLAKKGVIVTILSDALVEEKQTGLFYYETTRTIDTCMKITNRFMLDHLSSPTQFLIYMPKNQ